MSPVQWSIKTMAIFKNSVIFIWLFVPHDLVQWLRMFKIQLKTNFHLEAQQVPVVSVFISDIHLIIHELPLLKALLSFFCLSSLSPSLSFPFLSFFILLCVALHCELNKIPLPFVP